MNVTTMNEPNKIRIRVTKQRSPLSCKRRRGNTGVMILSVLQNELAFVLTTEEHKDKLLL